MNINLKKSLLFTFHYFDLLGKPLTLWEAWQGLFWLGKGKPKVSILEIQDLLEKIPELENDCGFYFLKGRRSLVKKRLMLHNFSQPKWERARRMVSFLSLVPFVRMIAVCNTVAFDTAEKGSDIDLLIIVREGRIWTSRFLITFLVALLGLRRHKDKIRDRFCLSFYLADSHLDLKQIALAPNKGKVLGDPYLSHWISRVSPLFDDGVGAEFFAQNRIMLQALPHWIRYQGVPRRRIASLALFLKVKKGGELISDFLLGDILEKFFRRFQLAKMSRNTKTVAQEPNTKVIISDQILKFHEEDLRKFYCQSLDKRLKFAKID